MAAREPSPVAFLILALLSERSFLLSRAPSTSGAMASPSRTVLCAATLILNMPWIYK